MAPGGAEAPPPPPPMSDKELDLVQKQTDALNQQTKIATDSYNTQKLLAPIIYKQYGVTPKMDDAGNITGFDQDPTFGQIQQNNNQITLGQQQRTLDAMAGKLGIDPALTRSMNTNTERLKNTLASNLGTDYATSSPGIEALANDSERRSELEYGAQRDQLTLGEQLSLASQQGSDSTRAAAGQGLFMPSNASTSFGASFGQAAQGYGAAQQPYQSFRGIQTTTAGQQASVASSNNASRNSMIGAGIGVAVGAGVLIF